MSDVQASAAFFRDRLGFAVDFLHGHPPFYGSVSRGGARLHLRFVHEPVLDEAAAREEALIMAFLEVENIDELFGEFVSAGLGFVQTLTTQTWGGRDFHVADPDNNVICFCEMQP